VNEALELPLSVCPPHPITAIESREGKKKHIACSADSAALLAVAACHGLFDLPSVRLPLPGTSPWCSPTAGEQSRRLAWRRPPCDLRRPLTAAPPPAVTPPAPSDGRAAWHRSSPTAPPRPQENPPVPALPAGAAQRSSTTAGPRPCQNANPPAPSDGRAGAPTWLPSIRPRPSPDRRPGCALHPTPAAPCGIVSPPRRGPPTVDTMVLISLRSDILLTNASLMDDLHRVLDDLPVQQCLLLTK
jgi:hypothetical protein